MAEETLEGDPAGSLRDALAWFEGVDVYLLDLLLRGVVRPPARVLDAGCGSGRNLVPLVRGGFEVHGIDASEESVGRARARVTALDPAFPPDRLRVARVEALAPTGDFDLVILVAVLHFARDEAHFDEMLRAVWGTVAPGGLVFARLASTTAMEDVHTPLGGGRFIQGDGDERFVVEADTLAARAESLGAEPAEPLKTVVVHGRRAMTNWILRRPRAGARPNRSAPRADLTRPPR